MKKIIKKLFICCMINYFINIPIIYSSTIKIYLEGVNNNLKKNIRAHLSKIDTTNISNKLYIKDNIIKLIKAGLRPFGYYEPSIKLMELQKSLLLNNKKTIFLAKIKLGKPIILKNIKIIIYGEAKYDQDLKKLIQQNKPKIGSILEHNSYENFKKKILNFSQNKGYFDAFFQKKQLKISIEKHEAFWKIYYNSGYRYKFGNVIFIGSQIYPNYLKNIEPLKNNDYYNAYYILELNRKLSLTEWFNTILITPNINYKTKIIPIKIILSPKNKNIIEIGLGYSTDVLLRMKIIWKKPWINSYGHSLISSTYISKLEQKINFNYKIPILVNPLEHYFLITFKWKNNNYYTKYNNSTLIISRYWDSEKKWQKKINLNWSFNHFIQKNSINNTMLIYPGININHVEKIGDLITHKGSSQNYSIDISSILFLSNINFLIFKAQNTWINSIFNEKHRIILRSNLGLISTKNFEKIPINLRFFASENHSIRGYKYQQFLLKNKSIGSSKLITESIEYQYNFFNKLWSVIFLDSGDAFNHIKKIKLKTGVGFGIRWSLPIGLIKFDLAFPINKKTYNNFQFYIGLGPEL